MPTTVRGLLFDLDNTLLDRFTAFFRVAESFYEEHLSGVTPVTETLHNRRSREGGNPGAGFQLRTPRNPTASPSLQAITQSSLTREDAVAMLVRWDDDGYSDRGAMLRRWLEEWPETGLDEDSLTRWYRAEMERQVEPDAQVNRMLADLNDRRVPWGIVTNGSPNQHAKCRKAGLATLAPFVIVSEEAGYRKPDPRIFRDALEATGLTAPEEVMFVGDNPVADIDGAKRFGMKATWIRRNRQYPSDLLPPDHVIDDVTEVGKIAYVPSRESQ